MVANTLSCYSIIPDFKKFRFSPDEFKPLTLQGNFDSTAEIDNSGMDLLAQLDEVFEACCNDAWDYDEKYSAKAISEESYSQAKRFIKYLDDVESPSVVPCFDGFIGFQWNTHLTTISIVFRENNTLTYSIVTDNTNNFGIMEQTDENQRKFVSMIFGALNNVF